MKGALILIIIGAMMSVSAAVSHNKISTDDDQAKTTISSSTSDQSTTTADEFDDTELLPLSGDVERRRSKNFRGDLGKRSMKEDEIVEVRRGFRVSKERFRPDLGKRSGATSGTSGRQRGDLLIVDSRINGLRRRFRPDLGKRTPLSPYDDNVDDDRYYRLSSLPVYGSESFTDDEDRQAITTSSTEDMWNDYDTKQLSGEENEEYGPEVDLMSSLSKRAYGRSNSKFRGDLGKRRSPSSFRGDLGKRSIRRRRSSDTESLAWQPERLENKEQADEINKRATDRADIDEGKISEAGDFEKRGRANLKSSFRGDLGKRRSSFRGDLGKRESSKSSNFDVVSSYEDAADNGNEIPSLGEREIEKRARTVSSFRGDLGKRRGAPATTQHELEYRSSFPFIKRPRPQSFRGDLGKRNAASFQSSNFAVSHDVNVK